MWSSAGLDVGCAVGTVDRNCPGTIGSPLISDGSTGIPTEGMGNPPAVKNDGKLPCVVALSVLDSAWFDSPSPPGVTMATVIGEYNIQV